MGKVIAMWERDNGIIEDELGNLYRRNKYDPRPSRCIKIGKVSKNGTQTSLFDYPDRSLD